MFRALPALDRILLPGPVCLLITCFAAGSVAAPAGADVDPRLDPEAVEVDSLGLTFHPPRDTEVVADRTSAGTNLRIAQDVAGGAWRINARHVQPDLDEISADAQAESLLDQLRSAQPQVTIIGHDQVPGEGVTGEGVTGELIYARQRMADTDDEVITGWLIYDAGDDRLLIFSIYILPDAFDEVRPLLRASFETVRLEPLDELSQRRQRRLEAGAQFLNTISEDDLRSLTDQPQRWFRHYHPTEDGREREVGYSIVDVTDARRGDLNPGRNPEIFSEDERERGLMVRVRARMIGDRDRNLYYDTEALYWLAWDRETEAWSIRTTARQGDAAQSESETGFRTRPGEDGPRGKLNVIKSRAESVQREPVEWEVPAVYLSQAERWILHHLLPERAEAEELAYYFYDTSSGRLSVRTDRYVADADDDNPGRWELHTQPTPDAEDVVSLYNGDNELVRRTRQDGAVIEPIERNELVRIWQRKGLTTDGREGSRRNR